MYEDWMVGVFGILGMAFFVGCTSCWHSFKDKPSDPAGRRQPPPPPTPDQEPRYELGLHPPNPPPDATTQHSTRTEPRENNEDSEENQFSVTVILRRNQLSSAQALAPPQPSQGKGQNPATSRKSTKESGARQGSYINVDEGQDYVNVSEAALNVSVKTEPHVYVEIVNCETNGKIAEKAESDKTPRSTMTSISKCSSQSDSLCHSYENVAVGSPPVESDLDYVNVTNPPAL